MSSPPNLGILPLASSPLRTLPPRLTIELAKAMAGLGNVTICLNKFQAQGRRYREIIAPELAEAVKIIDAFETIGGLVEAVRDFDYAVYADSGPAHISKLFAAPGMAVYTSAHGDILQGRFSNLANWTVDYDGPHCAAPCGLAKLRSTADGRVGCMGSLEVDLEDLPTTPKVNDSSEVARLLAEAPVPCVQRLGDQSEKFVADVLGDLKKYLPQNS